MNGTSVYKMGTHRNATKTGGVVQRYTSPTLLFHGGKPGDTANNLLQEI